MLVGRELWGGLSGEKCNACNIEIICWINEILRQSVGRLPRCDLGSNNSIKTPINHREELSWQSNAKESSSSSKPPETTDSRSDMQTNGSIKNNDSLSPTRQATAAAMVLKRRDFDVGGVNLVDSSSWFLWVIGNGTSIALTPLKV